MGVTIEGLEIYHPNNKMDSSYLTDKFGQDVLKLLNHLGRNERFVIKDAEENSLTMGVEAAKKVLDKVNITCSEIDIIVFVSDTFEYEIPTNALISRELLGAQNCTLVYDMNDSCIGMITAIDQVSTYMEMKDIYKNALIIGSSHGSYIAKKDCPLINSSGDAAAAVILKKDDCHNKGVIDAIYHTDSKNYKFMTYPECGFSNIFSPEINVENKKFNFTPHDVSYFSDRWYELIIKILHKNDVKLEEVKHFFFSQFSHADIKDTLEKLKINNPKERYTFVADKYGYTGNTSPFIAMYEALRDKKIGQGDTIVFCSVGAGYTMGAMIYKL